MRFLHIPCFVLISNNRCFGVWLFSTKIWSQNNVARETGAENGREMVGPMMMGVLACRKRHFLVMHGSCSCAENETFWLHMGLREKLEGWGTPNVRRDGCIWKWG